MKEQVFRTTKRRIVNQTFLIWLWILIHVGLNIWFVPTTINDSRVLPLVLGNLFFGTVSILAIIIFRRYYKYSINKKFIVTYNTLKFEDEKTQEAIEIKNDEVVEIKLVTNSHGSRFPWNFMEYFSLTDKNGNTIIITSFIMEISDFWLSTLTRKVSNKNFKREETIYPTFKLPQ
jgi:hypothetical protein